MTPMIEQIAIYLATDPDALGMDPDGTGAPAIITGARARWPEASDAQIAMACELGARRAQQRAAAHFAEADALDALAAAREARDRETRS